MLDTTVETNRHITSITKNCLDYLLDFSFNELCENSHFNKGLHGQIGLIEKFDQLIGLASDQIKSFRIDDSFSVFLTDVSVNQDVDFVHVVSVIIAPDALHFFNFFAEKYQIQVLHDTVGI